MMLARLGGAAARRGVALPSARRALSAMPVGWTQHADEAGTPYYHNTATKETSWELPAAAGAAPVGAAPAPAAAAAAAPEILTADELQVRSLPLPLRSRYRSIISRQQSSTDRLQLSSSRRARRHASPPYVGPARPPRGGGPSCGAAAPGSS